MPVPNGVALDAEVTWWCPQCPTRARTRVTQANSTEMHICAGLNGVYAPMQVEGTKSFVRVVAREDYAGDEILRLDGDGRPYMAVQVMRDDGYDHFVMAPLATLKIDADQLEEQLS